MASIKLKFRVSSLPEKEGTLYFQVIHERVVKLIGYMNPSGMNIVVILSCNRLLLRTD